ncbi:putative sulfate exporter family transporter, partial [Enterococcus faecium]
PKLGGATLAILLGIILGNTLFKQERYQVGTKVAESRLLEYSVVLLGFTVTFQTISEMGLRGFLFILLMMSLVITAAYLI